MAVIGTFGSYTAARLGIYASQASLNVTGHNIANINTTGFTRQRMDLRSIYGGAVDRYSSNYNVNIGYGVLTEGVSQLRDIYIDIRYRTEQSYEGQNEFKLKGLEDLAAKLDEVGKGTDDFGVIERQLSDLIQQLQNLSEKTGSQEYDTLVRGSAETLTGLMRDYAKGLETIWTNKKGEFDANLKEANTILTNIRNLNESIRKANICGDKALELRDERNVEIDKLSKLMRINVTYDMERIDQYTEVERLNISLADDEGRDVTDLVRGIFAGQLSYKQVEEKNPKYPDEDKVNQYLDKDGNPTNDKDNANMVNSYHFDLQVDALKNRWDVVFQEVNKATNKLEPSVDVDLADDVMVGGLQAIRELLTEEGEFASEDDLKLDPKADVKRGIPYYQKSLDALANKFAQVMNEANQIPMKDLAAAYKTEEDPAKSGKKYFVDKDGKRITFDVKILDGTTTKTLTIAGMDGDGNWIDANGNPYNDKGGTYDKNDPDQKPLDLSILSYDEKQAILDMFAEKSELTDEYKDWYKGGVLFTNGSKEDGTDKITAKNISVSHAWEDRKVQVMNTLRPETIVPATNAVYESKVNWSEGTMPKAGTEIELDGNKYTVKTGEDTTEKILAGFVAEYNGKGGTLTAEMGTLKDTVVFKNASGDVVSETAAQTWEPSTLPKATDKITIGGYTYEVEAGKNATTKDILNAFVNKYNTDTANTANADWEASVNAEGDGILFTAKKAGDLKTNGVTAPSGTTVKSAGMDEYKISHTTANDNIDHIIGQLTKKMDYDAADVPGSDAESNVYFTGSFQEYFTNMSHVLATDQETTSIKLNNHEVQSLTLENQRQSVSGVDLNDEATNMMQFQKSYQAACKLLTTLDAMLNTLINNTI